jgi:flagellar biosynthesis/type III secretory pathway M-ring protein FliF/YscJ
MGGLMAFVFVLVVLVVAWITIRKLARDARRKRLMAKYHDAQIVENIMRRLVWQGMTNDQLVDSLGRPADIDEKVYKRKTVHTYKYHQDGVRRFRTRVTVEDGQVVGWTER